MNTKGQLVGGQLENVAVGDVISKKASGRMVYDVDHDMAVVYDFNSKAGLIKTGVIVGTAADKTKGVAHYDETELQDAIDSIAAGGTVILLPGTYTGAISIAKKIKIIGDDELSIISGDVTYAAGANYSKAEDVKFSGNIVVEDTVTGVRLMGFMGAANTLTDDNADNSCNLYLLVRD